MNGAKRSCSAFDFGRFHARDAKTVFFGDLQIARKVVGSSENGDAATLPGEFDSEVMNLLRAGFVAWEIAIDEYQDTHRISPMNQIVVSGLRRLRPTQCVLGILKMRGGL